MDVLKILDTLAIPYELFEHEAVYTVAEAKIHTHHIQGMHCKNLFLRNRSGKQHYLFVMEENRAIDLKAMAKLIDETNLSFASEERLLHYMKLKPGSVSPLGLVNDEKRHVIVYLDESIKAHAYAAFHPNVNTHTVLLKTKDLILFLESMGYEVNYI